MKAQSPARMIPIGTAQAVSILLMLSLGTHVLPSAATQAEKDTVVLEGRGLAAMPAKANRYALIIGVNEYRDPAIGKLEGPSNDASGLANALVQRAGFPSENVIVLGTDRHAEQRPTRANVFAAISRLKKQVGDGLLLLSFSGHGIERSGEGYLLPEDAKLSDEVKLLEETSISVGTIRSWVREIGAEQVLMLLDACRNNPEAGKSQSKTVLSKAFTRGLDFKAANQGIKAFATLYATGVDQVAYENPKSKKGYFTEALIEAINGAARNRRGEVTLARLVSYVQEQVSKRVREFGKEQQPWAEISGFRAAELVISRVEDPDEIDSYVPELKYGFEVGPMGWRAERKANDSLACYEIAQSDDRASQGHYSLKAYLDLDPRDPRKGKGETWVYFKEYPPGDEEPPLDLTGHTITAWVYAPLGLRGNDDRASGYQVFAKDDSWNGQYGGWRNVLDDQWIELKLTVSATAPDGGYMSPNFNPRRIIAVGIKVALGGGSTATYKGPLYVDAITWTTSDPKKGKTGATSK